MRERTVGGHDPGPMVPGGVEDAEVSATGTGDRSKGPRELPGGDGLAHAALDERVQLTEYRPGYGELGPGPVAVDLAYQREPGPERQ